MSKIDEYRMCLNCGKVRPASISKHIPEPECLDNGTGLSGCTWDATPTEAWQHWRKVAQEERARAEKAEAELAAIKSGDMVLVPREPTEAMEIAGGYSLGPGGYSDPYNTWKAMLAAWQKEAGE